MEAFIEVFVEIAQFCAIFLCFWQVDFSSFSVHLGKIFKVVSNQRELCTKLSVYYFPMNVSHLFYYLIGIFPAVTVNTY
ncbi:hypothetical protein T12_2353 [Trichinella patagoniensis]|uniref:Uncharacterized protein n=1 Tax=Trichinella patagoniensis TaxID=990121 RepID=A0A0V0YWX9_9BILA|nr:hypothetical protein T12_2353 [Trichinella patagoniensis]